MTTIGIVSPGAMGSGFGRAWHAALAQVYEAANRTALAGYTPEQAANRTDLAGVLSELEQSRPCVLDRAAPAAETPPAPPAEGEPGAGPRPARS